MGFGSWKIKFRHRLLGQGFLNSSFCRTFVTYMSQMKPESKLRTALPTAGKMMLSFRFLALLALVVFLQQFAFTSFHGSRNHSRIYSIIDARYTQDGPAHSRNTPLGLEIEDEFAEDEDVQHLQDQSYGNLPKRLAVEEIHYTSFLKSRYLRLAHSVSHQTTVPFFILYNSWKSDLS